MRIIYNQKYIQLNACITQNVCTVRFNAIRKIEFTNNRDMSFCS